ncbi:phospholipid-binding protein MlaC [Pseudoruegeria sp. SHC-113]|uniref:MlaC/ttg2D family ABC transporter substrate-binding protein n=1 Tax=Pseudoruegeria sp. SHC-113 TaxID=2855439 RepID=UPI0021BB7466|nr:ABC transporter substrate-binding protein [Pseudoruegeria sp. SHC-113]MCT8159113.1 ABC transporter substrate-binding protein [Pseudoruegeria sp. SHC-113]
MPIPTRIPTPTEPTRRRFLAGLGALGTAALLPGAGHALNAGQAEALVGALVKDINRIINSGNSESAMYGDFERLFAKYADVPTIARYTLGADARSASSAQLRAYTSAFQGYISRKYGKRFREFIGGRLEVNSARAVKNFYEVKTTAYLRGEAPFEVTFLVSDRSGSTKFFNIFIEGVNMLLTERSEIGAMLDRRRGNLDQLTADLRKLP